MFNNMFQLLKTGIKKVIYKICVTCVGVLMEEGYDFSYIITEQQKKKSGNWAKGNIRLLGEGIKFNGRIHISDPAYVIIGNNVHIGDNAYFNTSGGLTIGDNTYISRNVTIYTQSHDYTEKRIPYGEKCVRKAVIINKNVWVGMNVSIAPGVKIGEGAIIGNGAVIASDVPPHSVVGMPKFRILKYRDIAHYDKLVERKQFVGISGRKLSPENNRLVNGLSKGKELFFIVSTGRAGSASISNTLNRHHDIQCYHEINRQLIRLSTEYAHKTISSARVKEELEAVYCECGVFPAEGLVGESNLKIGNLIEIISALLPKCKFVWIVRDGRSFVSSAYNRGWFRQDDEEFKIRHQWAEYRINGFAAGDVRQDEWNKMDSFGRCCWYWSYWNRTIQNQLSKLAKDRCFFVKLEDLEFKMSQLQSFLGVQEQAILLSKDNIAERKITKPYEQWSDSEINTFNRFCGETMNDFYPSV